MNPDIAGHGRQGHGRAMKLFAEGRTAGGDAGHQGGRFDGGILPGQLLYDRRNAEQALHQACRLGRWLDMVRHQRAWSPLVERIDPIHDNFHAVAATLVRKAREEGLDAMRAYYIREALPVSCSIREALRDISTMIREQTAFARAGLSELLGDGACPISREGLPPGDPLYKAHQIRDYFCEHPDAAPEACLRHIDTAAGGSDDRKGK